MICNGPGVDRCKANLIVIHFYGFLWISCAQGVIVARFGLMRYMMLLEALGVGYFSLKRCVLWVTNTLVRPVREAVHISSS